MSERKVWVRVGDQDEYHPFDSPQHAAEHVHAYFHDPEYDEASCGPRDEHVHAITRYRGPALIGVEVGDSVFTGENGISLYWGDGDAHLAYQLSDAELAAFTSTIGESDHDRV